MSLAADIVRYNLFLTSSHLTSYVNGTDHVGSSSILRECNTTKRPCYVAGRLFEDTKRGGNPVGDIWNDYHFELPSTDKKPKDEKALPHCNYSTRCNQCRGKA
jgi:hypothetical protein